MFLTCFNLRRNFVAISCCRNLSRLPSKCRTLPLTAQRPSQLKWKSVSCKCYVKKYHGLHTTASMAKKPVEDKMEEDKESYIQPTSILAEMLVGEDGRSKDETGAELSKSIGEINHQDYGIDTKLQELQNILDTEVDEPSIPTDDVYCGPDPDVPFSDVPCPGCGAVLHCQNTAIPGYMPSETFQSIPPKKLCEYFCQRCIFMRRFKMAINAKVAPEEYKKVIAKMKNIQALALMVVDVTDLPNSILPGLPQLIGKKRPLYVVANKVDLLPSDGAGYLKRVYEMVNDECRSAGLSDLMNLKHVALVSARTGYGIEKLITQLMVEWNKKGHVYLLGCTNVGKSTLFNSLLNSDYCAAVARDFINRATTSTWPGTTLSLLKFPILAPTPWRLHRRSHRIHKQMVFEAEEKKLRNVKYAKTGKVEYATLIGSIGKTFEGVRTAAIEAAHEQQHTMHGVADFSLDKTGNMQSTSQDLHENRQQVIADFMGTLSRPISHGNLGEHFQNSWWCYDSPGVINPAQIINLLGQQELAVLLRGSYWQPRSCVIKPTQVLFVSGLGRIDYVYGATSIYLTVFSGPSLPLYVVDGQDADSFYQQNVGTETLGIPLGNHERLCKLPSLVGKEIVWHGQGWQHSAGDIILSSVGFVAVTAGTGMEVMMRAYTPGGQGCGTRSPALLPSAVNQRGKRIGGTSLYKQKSHRHIAYKNRLPEKKSKLKKIAGKLF